MELGMIGLGRMGASLVARLARGGHRCVVHDSDRSAVLKIAGGDVEGAASISELLDKLTPPRRVWIMVPAAVVGRVVEELGAQMQSGDVIIDGGNSYYRDDLARAAALRTKGIHFVDCGTSGGIFGVERGFCLMIGGEPDIVQQLDPIFRSLAPGVEAAERTPGRMGKPGTAEYGYLHCGPSGAGHFVKMVHNGIEYGLMAAYAEGMNILRHANVGLSATASNAETTPLFNPQHYQYEFDLPAVAELWRRGSVVSSWLLDLSAAALLEDPSLATFSGRVSDSGEGRWSAQAAIDEGVPAPVISAALFERFASRGQTDYANRLLSALRKQFGGHAEKSEGGSAAP